jgi:hypothetical protein
MIFNDPTNKQGLLQEIDDICNSDNNSYPIVAKTRRLNSALDRFFTLAMQADGTWEEDDSTYLDYPIATTDLITGKQDYTFPSDLLEVFRVEIQSEDGNWSKLTPIDQTQIQGSINDMLEGESQPAYYDKKYSSIWLYPVSKVDIEDGLKLHFNRKLNHFVPTDTTRKAGIPPIFEQYLCRYASLPFLIEKDKANRQNIAQLIVEDEKEVTKYYSRRSRDQKQRLLARKINFI